MDYIQGDNLLSILDQRGPLPETESLELLYNVFDAVIYLHSNGVIHRDIKPDNIIITPNGGVLVDLGIAKTSKSNRSVRLGASGFAPPEQYIGGTTERSDIYSLGATLYCTLTNQIPIDAIKRHFDKTSMVLSSEINPTISLRMKSIILKAMDLNADERYATVLELQKQIYSNPPQRLHIVVSQEGKGHFTTIDDAIKIAPPDSLITVHPGVYHLDTTIDKNVTIIGEGSREDIIILRDEKCIHIASEKCIMRNLTVCGTSRFPGRIADFEHYEDVLIFLAKGDLILENCVIDGGDIAYAGIIVSENTKLKADGCLFSTSWWELLVSKHLDEGALVIVNCCQKYLSSGLRIHYYSDLHFVPPNARSGG